MLCDLGIGLAYIRTFDKTVHGHLIIGGMSGKHNFYVIEYYTLQTLGNITVGITFANICYLTLI